MTTRPPRILIITFLFPPFAGIGSVRLGKLARHLLDHGWDVQVLAAKAKVPESLAEELPPERIIYADWFDVDRIVDTLKNPLAFLFPARQAAAALQAVPTRQPAAPSTSRLKTALRNACFEFIRIPDRYVGWVPDAVRQGTRLLDSWPADLIYASAPPYSALLVGRALARRSGLPWVAEFRDPWTDNPYYEFTGLRRRLEAAWERRVLASTVGLVGVTEAWTNQLARRTGKPTEKVMNGFVLADFPQPPPLPPSTQWPLRILYTGGLYDGLRDPSPLLQALASLGVERNRIKVTFLGDGGAVPAVARHYDVAGQVEILSPVPYRESLELQAAADILLNLQSSDPSEAGWIPAKIFEYLAARRPILSIGYEEGEVGNILRDRQAGIVTSRPEVIASQLRFWIAEKEAGGIAATPASATAGFSRHEQFDRLDRFLRARLAGHSRPPA